VSYAQRGQNAGGLRFGTREVRIPPELDRDLEAMVGRGTRVYVVKEDLAARGIPEASLLPGLDGIARSQVARLFTEHDRILYW
jgi:sulfur transfer complex TusBCD TusB component (DsrH family)